MAAFEEGDSLLRGGLQPHVSDSLQENQASFPFQQLVAKAINLISALRITFIKAEVNQVFSSSPSSKLLIVGFLKD